MRRIVLLFLPLLLSHFAISQACDSQRYIDTIFHSVTETDNIYFGTATPFGLLAQPQDLYLDIYEPAGDTIGIRPIMIYQFGGGFVIGTREEPDIPQFCTYFAQLGYVVATIDYRIGLNPLDTNSTVRAFYRGVQDERSAIRYLCQRASQYKIDTSRIILTGSSAGCFCSFANGYMTDADRPACTYGTTLEPDDQGCFDCSGNTDFNMHIPHIKAILNQWGAMLDTSYINPGEDVPTISFHGDQDILVPYTYGYPFSVPVFPRVYGSFLIHQRMNNVGGILNVLHPLVGYSHEPELLAPQLNDTIYNYGRKFLYPLMQPSTSAISGDSVICAQQPTSYSVINTPGSIYCWDLAGRGTIVQDNNNSITVMWTDTGNVVVTVKELNNIHAEGDVKTFTAHVIPHALALFADSTSYLQAMFINQSTSAVSYLWDFGNGDTSTAVSPVVNYASGGVYTVTLVVDNTICQDTFRSSITLCPRAAFNFQLINQNQLDVSFVNTSANATGYLWDFGNGDTSTLANPDEIYTTGGTYTINLHSTITGCTDSSQKVITIDSCPVAHFTWQLNNLNGFFYADTTNTNLYSWSFGDGDTASLATHNVIHIYPHNGAYNVILKVKNQLGCESMDTVTINTVPTGINDLNNGILVICDQTTGCRLDVAGGGAAFVEVFDIMGRRVVSRQIESNYFLDTSGFTSGIYFLRVSNGEETLVKKFVRE